MEKLNYKDLVEKTVKELVKMRNEQKKELYNLRVKNSLRALTQTHLIKVARRNIARINTALSYKVKQEKWQ